MAIEMVDLPSCKMVDLSSEHLPEGSRYEKIRPEYNYIIVYYTTIISIYSYLRYGSVSKPCTPVVHIKIAGKWMFIPLKMVLS